MPALQALRPRDAADGLFGQWAGSLELEGAALPHRGRVRRWSYMAVADDDVAAGAAVVDLGYVVASFAWVCHEGRVHQWERKGLPRRHGRVPPSLAECSAWFRAGTDRVVIRSDATMEVDVGTGRERIAVQARITTDTSAFIVVPTAAGGWNATQKTAGEAVEGSVTAGPVEHVLDGAGSWRDYTVGRQDRDTVWRWAAGTGRSGARRVGLNLSTGMNERPPGENLVWWDGIPYSLPLDQLGPVGTVDGLWLMGGSNWRLEFTPVGVRAADENLLVVRSWYVQPIGTFAGTLPDPDGNAVEVHLRGVTEDHRALW